MRVPKSLELAFGQEFENLISKFVVHQKLLPEQTSIQSTRYLSRSILPHILRLSQLFNREGKEQESGLHPYWSESSNPAHLRLAYFLYFMPPNLFRTAAVWSELSRLGMKWTTEKFKAIEFGAGPASGAAGIAAGEKFSPLGLPEQASWALIEQNKPMLDLGTEWAKTYFEFLGKKEWTTRTFLRKIHLKDGFLPKSAPRFHLWLMSYFLNEFDTPPSELASLFIQSWEKHLEDEALIILIEPALKLQSRKLLQLRREILLQCSNNKISWLKILLPCLGHQSCGALNQPDDWCHEEVSWWRPPYFQLLDKLSGLDRKTLPFSYLVLAKTSRSREELFPALHSFPTESRYRLVSPAHHEGKDLEFFLCGKDGKRRTRYHPKENDKSEDKDNSGLQRGDVLLGAEVRGNPESSRADKIAKVT